jgi:hypothetical protein
LSLVVVEVGLFHLGILVVLVLVEQVDSVPEQVFL